MAENGGKNVPWWVTLIGTIGVPGFIALYVLGAVPGMPSPLQRSLDATQEEHQDIKRVMFGLKSIQEKLLDVQRTACRGTWKGNPEMQAQCDGRPEWQVPR